jgi:beta-1,2-mannosidase
MMDNDQFRQTLLETSRAAKESRLSPFFQTLSSDRFAKEYDPCDWAIGPFERLDHLTYEKKSQWPDPWNIGWEGRAIHNASLIEADDALYMFYRCNPSMESLAGRIGLAIYREDAGWVDWRDNPLIYSTQPNESLACEDPKVYRAEEKYYLFYQADFSPSSEDRALYQDQKYPVGAVGTEISVAISSDLLHWERKGVIIPRSISHLWAKAAVIPRAGNGDAVRLNGSYMMFVSEGCGGKQVIGYSDDLLNWEFKYERFLDTRPLGTLYEAMGLLIKSAESEAMVMDFFYDDGSGVTRAGQALYRKSEPTRQIALNRGGTLNVGGIIQYQGRWVHAQGWDAPRGVPVMYFYGTKPEQTPGNNLLRRTLPNCAPELRHL